MALSDLLAGLILLSLSIPFVNAQGAFGPYNGLTFPNNTIGTALLTQRDVSLDVPISHILVPGINLTSSWFWTRNYTVDNVTGISDLYDMGYRRFELDLWWNNATMSFQLCPEQIITNSSANVSQVFTTTLTQEATTTLASSTSSFSTVLTRTVTTSSTSAIATPNPNIPIPLANGYSCAPGADLDAVLDTIKSILSGTDNQLRQAGLIFLNLNLHALPSLTTRNDTIDLSTPSNSSLSEEINQTLADWLYTPVILANERQNINTSFLSDTANPIIDIPAYYTVIINNQTKFASTPNGWPTTRHLFETSGRRLLIGFGSVDLPSDLYDITQDDSTIFPPGTFGGQSQIIPANSITNGFDSCLGPDGAVFGTSGEVDFNSTTTTTANFSFASSETTTVNNPLSYDSLQAIVSCGLSPIVNSPLQDVNSGNSSPFNPIAGTIWSWLPPSEPKNTSLPTNGTENVVACAALLADSGRWIVLDCNVELSLACRLDDKAYQWEIGDQSSFFQATTGCPSGSSFGMPRTALENRYLVSALRKTDIKSIWIDLNSLKAPDCWTIGNSNCPYGDSTANLREQKVLVPIVGSIIVITVFILMCLVKWQRYWLVRAARKRRRLVKGFLEYADYEGIPA